MILFSYVFYIGSPVGTLSMFEIFRISCLHYISNRTISIITENQRFLQCINYNNRVIYNHFINKFLLFAKRAAPHSYLSGGTALYIRMVEVIIIDLCQAALSYGIILKPLGHPLERSFSRKSIYLKSSNFCDKFLRLNGSMI